MKNFMRFSMIAVAIVLVAVMASMFVAPVSAATTEGPTIYISDTGDGDGSSESSPLAAETRVTLDKSVVYDHDNKAETADACQHGVTVAEAEQYYCACFSSTGDSFCQNSVLYQAAEKLSTTGGKIVLVGDVKLEIKNTAAQKRWTYRDFNMPTYGQNKITITSNGSGKLILEEGVMLKLGGYTVFEDLEIKTVGHEYNSGFEKIAICACGNKAVFESTVTCSAETDTSSQYPTLVGGKRYGKLTGDTDLTIAGGTWYGACGSNYGNPGDRHEGNSKLTITGGTFKYYVTAGAWRNGAFQYGDSELYISGGNFGTCCVFSCSNIGVGRKGTTSLIKVVGDAMTLGNGAIRDIWKYDGSPVEGCIKPTRIVDLTECTRSNKNKMVATTEFVEATDYVYYPTSSIKSVTMIDSPVLSYAFNGELIKYDATGLSVNIEYGVEYSNGREAKLAYSPDDNNFAFSVNNGEVTGTYGNTTISGLNKAVTVVEDPTPTVRGAQISVVDKNGGLRFVAERANSSLVIVESGFYVWDSTAIGDEEIVPYKDSGIDFSEGQVFRADSLEYNNNEKSSFSIIYDNIQLRDYASNIKTVAYVKYKDGNNTYTTYSEPIERSVLWVAEQAVDSDKESVEAKEFIQKNIIDKYNDYLNDLTAKTFDSAEYDNSDALREIVINEFLNNANYKWTPSSDIDLTGEAVVDGVTYKNSNGYTYNVGTIYYGMPYINNAKHELSEFKSFMKARDDGTNVYYGPIKGALELYTCEHTEYTEKCESCSMNIKKNALDEKYYDLNSFFTASDFTGMVINAWNKVSASTSSLSGLGSFIPGANKGVVAVGGYDYSESKVDTYKIAQDNTLETMKSAYAACKPGDVVVCLKYNESGTTTGASLWMVKEAPKDENLTVIIFGVTRKSKTVDGVSGLSHFYEETHSFEELYNAGFIPVTIPELATGTVSKTTTVVSGFDGEMAMKTGKLMGNLISNKQILSVNVKLSRNENDGEFYDETVYCNSSISQNVGRVDLSCFDFSEVLQYLVDGKTYTLTINADIADKGVKTIASYSYKEPTVNLEDTYVASEVFEIGNTNIIDRPIEHMKEQMNIYWTPATTFQYTELATDTGFVPNTKFVANTVYRGVLYANTRATLADFVASLGSSTNKTIGGTTKEVYTLGSGDSNYSGSTHWNKVVGNHCSASMYHGYQKVVRLHASSRGNANMELLGKEIGITDIYKGVGSYTSSVTKAYGNQAMYELYALAKKGDFLYHNTTGGGHTRMIQKDAHVERDSNGMILPDQSYIIMIEQTDTTIKEKMDSGYKLYVLTDKDGYECIRFSKTTPTDKAQYKSCVEYTTFNAFYKVYGYDSTWWEHSYTFTELATKSIILRPHEYMTGETEDPYIGLTKNATESLLEAPSEYKLGFIESNYPILTIRATITDQNGNILDKVEKRGLTNVNSYNIGQLFTTSEDAKYIQNTTDGYLCTSNYKGKSYTYTLEVELAAGKAVLHTFNVEA